jgi:NAD(P)-dependent dehydrogenase (short-subunit alcohol dehydrogenase family)
LIVKCRVNAMNPIYDFHGQVALLTGAGGGIGLAAASAFAKAGASVIIADDNAMLLREAADGLRSAVSIGVEYFPRRNTFMGEYFSVQGRSRSSVLRRWRAAAEYKGNDGLAIHLVRYTRG